MVAGGDERQRLSDYMNCDVLGASVHQRAITDVLKDFDEHNIFQITLHNNGVLPQLICPRLSDKT